MPTPTRGHLLPIAAIALGTFVVFVVARLLLPPPYALWALLGDTADLAKVPWFFGLLSTLGLMGWGAAAGVGALGWRILRDRSDAGARDLASALGGFALLSLVLGIDDLAQVHEVVIPSLLGIPENAVLAGYGLWALGWLVRFRRTVRERAAVPVGAAATFFALSVFFDVIPPRVWDVPIALEEGPKLVGILVWTYAGAVLAASAFRAPAVRAGPQANEAAAPDPAAPQALRRSAP